MTATNDDSPPWKLEFRSSKGFIISVVAISVLTDVFIYGMIIPILPIALGPRAGIPDDQLQKWMSILLAAFGGALLVSSPICGHFADKAPSRRIPFLVGLAALGGSTVMFWFAHSIAWLFVARVLQGLSCAVVWTVGMALVADTVGKEEVGSAMGYVSMAMTAGAVSGPFIGGIVLARAGYHAVFSMAIGLIVLDILLRLVMIERKAAAKWIQPSGDDETEALLGGSERPVSYNGEEQETSGDQNGDVGEPDSSGRTGSLPGIARLLCSGNMLVILGATIFTASAASAFDTVLPLRVLRLFHWDSFRIGMCFLPLCLPAFASPKIGAACDRVGTRVIAFLGFLLDFPVFMLLQLVTENTTRDQVLLYVILAFAGISASLQMVSLMTEVDHIAARMEKQYPGMFGPQGCSAQAYGLLNVAWAGGQMLGPLVAGFLVDLKGWGFMVSVFGVVSGTVAVVISLTSGKSLEILWKRKGRE